MKSWSLLALGIASLGARHATAQESSPLPSSCGTVNGNAVYASNPKLPDPYLRADGTRLSTLEQWACKREEIRQQSERLEFGTKPAKPTVAATMTGSTISITVTDAGKSISFSVSIKAATSGTGPFPAVIAFGSASIPVPSSVSQIIYNNQDIANDNPHGVGKFYNLYGSSHPAGGLIAWAWGVSRIIDALEILGSSKTNVDLKRLGVTGCSRNGKGALLAGAFDDRIALTLPQEGGSGGAGCWRIVDDMKKNGTKVEDSTQIVQGDGWFTPSFTQTANNVNVLPYDHHMIMGLVAPRALLIIENSGIDYLGPPSTYGCSSAAKLIYKSLGVPDNMGFTQVAHGSSHCQMPSSQNNDVSAFYNKFFFNQTATTDFIKTDGSFSNVLSQWANWTLPALA